MKLWRIVPVIIMAGLLGACQPQGTSSAPQQNQTDSCADADVLATIDGTPITEKDIEAVVPDQLRQVRMELYAAHKAGVDQLINEKLLAAEADEQGVTVEELQKKEIGAKVEVTDDEVEKYYNQRKARFQGKEFSEVASLLKGYLYQQKFSDARNDYLGKLKKKSKIQFMIEPPRVEVVAGDYPGKGPEKAPIQIIEFSDYQCPFCGRARETIAQVLKEYGNKVRYVFRDFPLSFHKEAQKAHEAAHCAREQGKYWQYNDQLFKQQRALTLEDLKKYAKELKLNQEQFEECLGSDKYTKMVQDSLRYGQSVGVSGTPAYFINGRMLSGARPFPAFKEVIDDELAR